MPNTILPRRRFSGTASAEYYSAGADVSHAQGPGGSATWGEWEARSSRYDLYWGMYEATTYDKIHQYAEQFKIDRGLYPEIRDIFNPTYRLVEFWAAHLMGGTLDANAGDGKTVPSALPIETENESLRPAISQLWRHTRWQQAKTVWSRLGAKLGDVGLETVDDVARKRVYHRVVDPRTIVDYDPDSVGNCRGYTLEEFRPDPRPESAWATPYRRNYVIFRQEVRRLPNGVSYATYLGDGADFRPFNWSDDPGAPVAWTLPYPFVPFVLVNHIKLLADSPFGAAEIFAGAGKVFEIDHLASQIGDAIGKSVDPAWLLKGIQKPQSGPTITGAAATTGNPKPRRSEVPALYAGAEAAAQPLVAPHDIAGWLAHVSMILDAIKEDYPEVRRDNEWSYGDASGKSLRVARQRVETKAIERRSGYDAALVQATQQAIAIGGWRDYEGYQAFDFESYGKGDLDFRIGNRSVFGRDPEDDLERDKNLWANAESADRAGCPVDAFLQLQGWSPERIAIITKAQDKAMEKGLAVGRSKQAPPPNEAAAAGIQAPGGSAP